MRVLFPTSIFVHQSLGNPGKPQVHPGWLDALDEDVGMKTLIGKKQSSDGWQNMLLDSLFFGGGSFLWRLEDGKGVKNDVIYDLSCRDRK